MTDSQSQPTTASLPLRETVALALMNVVRENHGLDVINWDFPAISSWHRANALKQADAAIAAVNSHAALSSRIAELESNERAYEAALGQRTYNEVAEHIAGLERALRIFADDASWRLSGCCDPNSVNFNGQAIACAALTSPPEVKK